MRKPIIVVIVCAVSGGVLLIPATANGSYYMSIRKAKRVTLQIARTRAHLESPEVAGCRPADGANTKRNRRYRWHRWICGFQGNFTRSDGVQGWCEGGSLRLTGKRVGTAYKIRHRATCSFDKPFQPPQPPKPPQPGGGGTTGGGGGTTGGGGGSGGSGVTDLVAWAQYFANQDVAAKKADPFNNNLGCPGISAPSRCDWKVYGSSVSNCQWTSNYAAACNVQLEVWRETCRDEIYGCLNGGYVWGWEHAYLKYQVSADYGLYGPRSNVPSFLPVTWICSDASPHPTSAYCSQYLHQ
jgi:hypothetical protein